ncbi:MAG TPA: hypothetical protein VFA49_13170 [Chloroflexota bacterium]|jgi:hypothetical protein|nr:hypothetical protein [Chloroflexota bacterium]
MHRQPVLPFLVALLVVLTTPVGTGHGVHQADLLHPLLPHNHLVDGHIIRGESPTPGPALGSGTDVAAGPALSPTLPLPPRIALVSLPAERVATDVRAPDGRVEAPPDPPPTA